ncbi:MAG: phage baseplate protein, partial [Thermoguttaceae bacterium]
MPRDGRSHRRSVFQVDSKGTGHCFPRSGGEKTHTLTIDEMPSHSHHISSVGIGSGFYGYNISSLSIGSEQKEYTDNTGENQPHNNLQPYQVVGYMWI